MVKLLAIAVAIMSVGCGVKGDKGDAGSAGQVVQIATPPSYYDSEITLEAYRTYSPSKWFDGVSKLETATEVVIPNQLNVLYGNAGNHKATLKFDGVTCEYRGGSSSSKPLSKASDQKEIELGRAYLFQRCLDESGNVLNYGQNDSIVAHSELLLHVDDGDSTQETYVQVVVREVR